ncbi:MAG: hypothetical protein A2W03_08745 [Candidatus Aminicenantes bacterium RBG_16_63_16]|nr:MAG: hypothetical protein A2W03_08745 [Candidatus Aminicenantes bacterium RBG_16_63_16]
MSIHRAAVPGNRLFQVLDYVNSHFKDDLTLRDTAARFGCSPFHLTRLFKKGTGLTFGRYIRAKRLLLAKDLLENMSVTEACFEVGFENLSHFSRAFKSKYGRNPSGYKKGLWGEPLAKLLFSDDELARRCLGQKLESFVEQYYRRTLEILAEIRDRESDKLQDAADRCASSLRDGRRVTVISYDSEGYLVEASGGGPHLDPLNSIQRHWYPVRKSYDPARRSISIVRPRFPLPPDLGRGDVLISAFPLPEIKAAAGRGAEVIGLAGPFFDSRAGRAAPLEPGGNNGGQEDVSGPVIECHVPLEDGLVCVPEIPVAPFAPASTLAQILIRLTLGARLADRMLRRRGPVEPDPAETVIGEIAALSGQAHALKDFGARMAERVIAGGKLYIGGTCQTIHEFTWRGSGLMGLQPLRTGQPTDGDAAIIDVSSGMDQEMRRIMDSLGAKGTYAVFVLPAVDKKTSPYLSDSPKALLSKASAASATAGFKADDKNARPSPGRLLSWTLLWMLLASYLQEMVIRGRVPFVFRGFHLPGGKKYNEAVYPLYVERGY